MGLLDDIRAEGVVERRCSVRNVLDSMDKSDAEDLREALEDDSIAHTVITRVLIARGYDMHDKRIAAHRRGQCACAR
jgi:hypothetical protein